MALDKLTQFQWAGLAAKKLEKDPGVALASIRKFYQDIGVSVDDPIMAGAFNDAEAGLQAGHITSRGVLGAISLYSNNYNESFQNATVDEIVSSSNYNLSTEAREGVMKYKGRTFRSLLEDAKKDKNDKDLIKAVNVVQIVDNYKFEAELYPQLTSEITTQNIEAYFPKKEDSEGRAVA